MKRVGDTPLYVWAGRAPDDVPDRVAVVACPSCAALVQVERLDVHRAWHRGEEAVR